MMSNSQTDPKYLSRTSTYLGIRNRGRVKQNCRLSLLILVFVVQIFMPAFVSLIAPGFIEDEEKMGLAINKGFIVGSLRYCHDWLKIKSNLSLDGRDVKVNNKYKVKALFLIPKATDPNPYNIKFLLLCIALTNFLNIFCCFCRSF